MLKRAYFEITNVCNLSCSFCHGTKRPPHSLSRDEFIRGATEIRKHTEYIYFHLMGEPLLHPLLEDFLSIANDLKFKVIITTNGTLLKKRKDILLSAPALHKVSISLHAYEANDSGLDFDEILSDCFEFCSAASQKGIISVMRLWNLGGLEENNARILKKMKEFFPEPWTPVTKGERLRPRLFLEWGEKFDWPDESADEVGSDHSCYGLRDQVGILSDGSVVPCCLDADGVITLGHIFEESLEDILQKPRACALRRSFENRSITEPLCLRCGFAAQRVK